MNRHEKGIYEKYIKRLQDVLFALIGIILLSPLMVTIALLVRINLGTPIIFRQERPGLNNRIFHLYKFRTMTDETDEDGNLLPDEERLGSFGRKLRATSLDELPALFNVLQGTLSIVGPRPLLVKYLPRYSEYQARRHDVRPGFTGYAQVNGRNAISWNEKFNYDVKYTEHITFWGDWRIILKTVIIVLKREGISAENSVTMDEFMGNHY